VPRRDQAETPFPRPLVDEIQAPAAPSFSGTWTANVLAELNKKRFVAPPDRPTAEELLGDGWFGEELIDTRAPLPGEAMCCGEKDLGPKTHPVAMDGMW